MDSACFSFTTCIHVSIESVLCIALVFSSFFASLFSLVGLILYPFFV